MRPLSDGGSQQAAGDGGVDGRGPSVAAVQNQASASHQNSSRRRLSSTAPARQCAGARAGRWWLAPSLRSGGRRAWPSQVAGSALALLLAFGAPTAAAAVSGAPASDAELPTAPPGADLPIAAALGAAPALPATPTTLATELPTAPPLLL